jgi:acyl-homoserine-lactone acylase
VWAHLDTDSNLYTTPFNPADPLTTPVGLNTGPGATPLKFLADAVQNLEAHHVPLAASYGQVEHAPQSPKLFVHGCDTGCFSAVYANDGTPATSGPLNAAPYGQVYDGSSLVMTTQLNPSGPMSQGILTYSQATNPRSRWHANMTKLYAQSRWISLAYTAAQLRHEHPLPTQTFLAP